MQKITKLIRIGLLTIISLISYTAYSQENYIPGYIIKTGNDTIRGFIDYRNWEKNPDFIEFKTSITDNPARLIPTEVNEFGVVGEVYVGGIVETEVTPTVQVNLKHEPRLNIEVDTVFLLALLRGGDKELYYYLNEDSRVNFYIKNGKKYELLIYKQYLKKLEGRDAIIENKKYLGQLSIYLNDCQDIESRLRYTSYSQKSLMKLFRFYYKCSSSDISLQKETYKLSAEYGILAGVTSSSLKFEGPDFKYLTRADINKQSLNFTSGIFLDLILPRNQGKWSIYNELSISSFKFNTEYDDLMNSTLIKADIAYTYLKINNLVRFKYPLSSVSIFINGGVSNGWAIKETNTRTNDWYSADRIEVEPALPITKKNERGLILGAGIKYKSFSFETRLEKGEGMSRYILLASKTTRYHFLFGYKF